MTEVPVVLHELHDRGLVADGVADVIRLGPRRDHQQGEAGAVATPSTFCREWASGSAGVGTGEGVGAGLGRVVDAAVDMVVEAVRVVVGDDHGGARPGRKLFEGVDLV